MTKDGYDELFDDGSDFEDPTDNLLDGVDTETDQKGVKDEVVPPTTADDKSHTIPVTALLDEREKRQEWQRKAEEAEKRLQQYEQKSSTPAQPMSVEEQIEARIINVKVGQSQFLAEKDFGKELIQETMEYFNEHPGESWKFKDSLSPWHDAVAYYQKQKRRMEIGDDPDAYIEAQVQARLAAMNDPQSAKTMGKPTAKSNPPPSAAKAPGTKDTKPQNGFDSLFNR